MALRRVGCLAAMMTLWGVTDATAQQTASSLEELRQTREVQVGDTITVVDSSGRRITGLISRITLASLDLTGFSGRLWSWTEAEIQTIERRDGVADGLIKGLIGGATVTAAMALYYGGEYFQVYTMRYGLLLAVPAGVGIGAAIDALTQRTVYAAPRGAHLRVLPAVARGQMGARVSVTW